MLLALLAAAARDLVYSSETDAPFEVVSFEDDGQGVLDAARFAARANIPENATIAMRSLDAFLARHIETSDPFDTRAQAIRPRYEHLKTLLQQQLPDLRVYRVTLPGDVRVRCYIVGRDPRGAIAGLMTVAVET